MIWLACVLIDKNREKQRPPRKVVLGRGGLLGGRRLLGGVTLDPRRGRRRLNAANRVSSLGRHFDFLIRSNQLMVVEVGQVYIIERARV